MAKDDDVPVIEVEEVGRTVRRPIDAVARAKFLDELKRTGSRQAAAAAARPHIRTRRSAYSAFINYMQQHPQFEAQVLDAEAELAGAVEIEIRRRAFDGVVTYEKRDENGNVLEQKVQHDNKLLLGLARRLAGRNERGAWVERKELTVTNVEEQQVTADVDKVLEELDDAALKQLMGSLRKNRQLTAANQAEDAELVAEELLDDGPDGN